jgi:hypothetical protein
MAPARLSQGLIGILFGLGALLFIPSARAQSPTIYGQTDYESPVRGDPEDLLMLPGSGFSSTDVVIYSGVQDTSRTLAKPSRVPSSTDESQGTAPVVSYGNVPHSLTIRLPAAMRAGQSYALWVVNPHGDFSNGVLINDARPLWISPALVYASQSTASLPRYLKIVGRNLQPAPGQSTKVKLVGPAALLLTANAADTSPELDRYVAQVSLPKSLQPGRYRVEVSRDGTSWVVLRGQILEVRSDPSPSRIVSVQDPSFGGCRPNDGRDATACIRRAIEAVKDAGGTVAFGAGVWNLSDEAMDAANIRRGDGIVVPSGVNLHGDGSATTRIIRHRQWTSGSLSPAFSLMGHNLIDGFTFADEQIYVSTDRAGAFLQLGISAARFSSLFPSTGRQVTDVTITGNVFDKTWVGISDAGLPVARLFVTHNVFGGYISSLELSGDRFNMLDQFDVADTVITQNVFKPSSLLDVKGEQGPIAAEIGAAHRLDFSNNDADGTSTDYLYSPDDARGWRGSFSWHLMGNHEMELISNNLMSCSGDKVGDGEAIEFDDNANTFALKSARAVTSADENSVAIAGPLVTKQNGRDIPLAGYYVGHWIMIGGGTGLGQVRKITSYSIDAGSKRVVFRVVPKWDVTPQVDSRMTVGREFWQVYAIANTVEHRRPPCLKSNRSQSAGGQISLWAQMADSVVEGNRLYDTSGILLQQNYVLPDKSCADCGAVVYSEYFTEIRSNTIVGEYDWDSDCSSSGIIVGVAASPDEGSGPPVLGYGVAIAHNIIQHADAAGGGAISFTQSWWPGPPPHRWPIASNTLVYANDIRDINGGPPKIICNKGILTPRVGIRFPEPQLTVNSVLYGNSCTNVSFPLQRRGNQTTDVCPSTATQSCECR